MQEKTTQKTLPPDETALFCEQIAMVLQAGIPLGDGMETLARSYAGSRYGARFEEMHVSLERGGTFSQVLEKTGIFPDYLLAMTRIGERSGKLDEVMASLANYYQWEAQIKSSVKSAILYPSVLVMMLAVVIAILVISVLPVFQRVFDSLGLAATSPATAAMQIGVGVGKGMLILVGVFALLLLVVGILLSTNKRKPVLALLAGVIPAVLMYYLNFYPHATDEGALDFLLTAGAIGLLYKLNASISGAEVGCQGEVGVACSMAAGAYCAVTGGSVKQVEVAAEIGMEHNLGLTCDPVGGLVQIPCIERNGVAAERAVNCAQLSRLEDGRQRVISLDAIIEVMYRTGLDLQSRYKETSLGGLAQAVAEALERKKQGGTGPSDKKEAVL